MSARYIPALSYNWLTPFYDWLFKWTMHEQVIKTRLIERAHIQPGQIVLDLGCGTGTLSIMTKRLVPEAIVIGLDGDEQVLKIARLKAERAKVNIRLDLGLAYELPYPDHSVDVVLSSFVVHHLTSENKLQAFKEVRRVLRPGGGFHILDFGHPFDLLTRAQAAFLKLFEQSSDNLNGRIPHMLKMAEFDSILETEHVGNIFGPLWYYEAHKNQGDLA